MPTITPTRSGPAPLEALKTLWRSLRAAAAERQHRRRCHQDRQATQRALGELDAHLLRDIGIDRSEISSIAYATLGAGDETRVRLALSTRQVTAFG